MNFNESIAGAQEVIDALTRQIEELTEARDGLIKVISPFTAKKKPAHRSALSVSGKKRIAEAQRKRWAEQKRKARAKKKVKKVSGGPTKIVS
jgi:hydroxymethylglutaryl-CoA reductase